MRWYKPKSDPRLTHSVKCRAHEALTTGRERKLVRQAEYRTEQRGCVRALRLSGEGPQANAVTPCASGFLLTKKERLKKKTFLMYRSQAYQERSFEPLSIKVVY